MNKYNSQTIYRGNLMKHTRQKEIMIKENIDLIYDEMTDSFYSYPDIFNYKLDLSLNSQLTKEQKEKYQTFIANYKYTYTPNGREGEIYIDEKSLAIVLSKENNKNMGQR